MTEELRPSAPIQASPSFSKSFGQRKIKKKTTFGEEETPGGQKKALADEEGTPAPPSARQTTQKVRTIADFTRLLDMDAQQLGNMKTDIEDIQARELEKVQRDLAATKREHDALISYNKTKRAQIEEFKVRTTILKGVEDAVVTTKQEAQEKIRRLEKQLAEVKEMHEMEQRAANMLHHMHLRIYNEIGAIRKVSEATIISLEKNRAEYSVIENTLRYLKQEGSVQERQYDELTKTTRQRKEQMVGNKSHLSYLLHRSENSISYAKQDQLFETASFAKSPSSRGGNRSRGDMQSAGAKTAATGDVLAATQYLTATQIQDLVARYKSRGYRVEYMKQLIFDIEEDVEELKQKKTDLAEGLEALLESLDEEISTRQIHFENEKIEVANFQAINRLRGLKDDVRQLETSLKSLCMAVPRFISKLTKETAPPCLEDELPQHVGVLYRVVITAVQALGCSISEDASKMGRKTSLTQQNTATEFDMNTEIALLQKMPGYAKVQRQTFLNIMSANPDESESNMRNALLKGGGSDVDGDIEAGSMASFGTGGFKSGTTIGSGMRRSRREGGPPVEALTRETIKNVSALIVEKGIQRLRQQRAELQQQKHGRMRRIMNQTR